MENEIGKYQIKEVIHEGQLSTVLVVEEKQNSIKKYALKKLKIDGLNDEDKKFILEIFRREKEALSQLNHPNVIKYVDSFEDENNYYLVTEYDENLVSLDKLDNSLSEKKKFEIILELLDGFSACHEKKIIHRDIKPSNILISNEGSEIKIIDFGISKIKDSITFKTTTTLRDFMSQPFASPEQKKKFHISEESDIYSLGLLIHYIFTKKILNTETLSTNEEIKNSTLPSLLKPIIIKATSTAREDRYSSVDVLINEIKNTMLKIDEQKRTLNLTYSNHVISDLYNLEKIQGTSEIFAKQYILDSLKEYKNIYMGNNEVVYIVGEDVKYRAKILNDGQIIITKVWNLDNLSQRSKGAIIGAKVEVYSQRWNYEYKNERIYLDYLREKIELQYKKDQAKKLSKDSMSKLLSVWDDYLKVKKQKAYLRTNLGRYIEYQFNENLNFLEFKLDGKYDFEEEDKIQLVSKNGKKLIVGEFYQYLDEDKIKVIASKNFNEENFNDKGSIGVNNYMASKLTIRYSEAMRQLLDRTSVNTFLLDILNNPTTASKSKDQFKITKKYNEKILDNTIEVIESALTANDLYLIQGPPGTGKTTLISEMIAQIYEKYPYKRVLFVSPSHVAVDHAMKSIRKNIKKVNKNADNFIVRLGKEEKISKDNEILQVDQHTIKWAKKVKRDSLRQLESYLSSLNKYSDKKIYEVKKYLNNDLDKDRRVIESLIVDEHSEERKLITILKDWYIDLSQVEQFEQKIIENSFLVCSTCSGISSYDLFDFANFDWVIIDEAARATVPELLIPLVRARKAILVGDHQQLPPIVNIDGSESVDKGTQQSLEDSLFKYLYKSLNQNLKTTLDIQFRMNPAIANMINHLYYREINITNYFEDKDYLLSQLMKPITWIDTNNSNNKYQTKENNSYKNYEEVNQIEIILDKINNFLEKKKRKMAVGVISGYEAQKNLLVEKLSSKVWNYLDIEINNVDAFQGSEKDIIIYSVVRSNKKSDLGFLKDERRLNVSLSRAKEQLIIVGDSDVSGYYPHEANPFTRLINYIAKNPVECRIEV
ncbi:AAA domain-containing protein [Carnobacterium maltaromaticum]|uniref:AAA domain-containing protein n=1 Tax=Carnobacterium maltaromaticum TaxID=2751 RepID=A0AAW9K134_CARML|nr:AAA domain-containing protein [Carnobacterium maltaromaticum]MDZ5757101.1 AAA domain-containing protein [Carnobacterium maltaromaticum]